MPVDSTHPLRVDLLGPVRAWRGEVELVLGSAQRKAVLAMLAIRPGQAVSRDELVNGVWGETSPPSADGSLYTHVSGLRRVFDPVRDRWSTRDVLVSAGSGYSLRLAPEDLDVHRFTTYRDRAQSLVAAGQFEAASTALSDALALWQGEALSGINGPFAEANRARLAELRLATIEHRVEVNLHLGRYRDLIAELLSLVKQYPLRDGLCGLLMRALYAAGRPADALEAYRAHRDALIDELGIEPGPALTQLHGRVLANDPSLESAPTRSCGNRPNPPVAEQPSWRIRWPHRRCSLDATEN